MKSYAITFTLFGLKRRATVTAPSKHEAIKKVHEAIIKQVQIESIEEPEPTAKDIDDAINALFKTFQK